MTQEFPKAYEPKNAENKWYSVWMNNDIYKTDDYTEKKAYSILMPPPNVTGILHFGHMLNNTLQDLYTRYKRMNGYESCWFPGTDHAGIATQARVESQLKKEGITRYDLGREKFVEKVWEWRDKYGGIILSQLRKLGVSCDWNRTLFTMDESASNAVNEVFVRLYEEGLIYRGKRIINWSPLAQTALSDEEVEFREVKEHIYTMRYHYEDGNGYLMVATVRPETIFGDVAVAVNPKDERYQHLIGKNVIVPLVNRLVPVIADDYADPAFGTGCVKITPAHDPNDFLVGERHNLEQINTINPDGTLNELTGDYSGVERFEARKLILKKLKELDLIEKIEDYTHNVGFSQRGGEPVEPYLSDQWFVKMKPLAEESLHLVTEGRINFHPAHWVKTYEHWMTNIRDWCISRQLWWGHRIPVYYATNGRYTAARDEKEARVKLGISQNETITRDNDVLDTWFSSWLWPLTTMHWLNDGKAETTPALDKFLPTDLLVTAPDIIFFWVARMIMATYHFKKEIPFKDVYFTSTIRDGLGRKLSKSLGNSPDPLNIIDKYGADAVRFTMIYLAPLGQDVKMDVDVEAQDIPSIEIGRNFCNKIWNAGRFIMMKKEQVYGDSPIDLGNAQTELTIADQWILSRFNSTLKDIENTLNTFKVTDYSKLLYDFIWRDFCDWYVEILKVQLNNSQSEEYSKALVNFAVKLYEDILLMIHPVMPFISEEIWHITGNRDANESISLQAHPTSNTSLINSKIEEGFAIMQMVVDEVRRMRSGSNIAPSVKLDLHIVSENEETLSLLQSVSGIIQTLGRCNTVHISAKLEEKPPTSISSVVRNIELFLPVGDVIDLDAEKARLNKEKERLEGNIMGTSKKLSNEKFVANAAPEVVEREREKLDSMTQALEKVKNLLENLN